MSRVSWEGVGVNLVVLAANPSPGYWLAMEVVRENGRVAVLTLPCRGEAAYDFNPFRLSIAIQRCSNRLKSFLK